MEKSTLIETNKKYFYVYKLTLPETGEFYYGRRVCGCKPEDDTKYLGSMKTWKPDKSNLIKEIIKECNTFEESEELEIEILEKYIDDPLNRNYVIGHNFHYFGNRHSEEYKKMMKEITTGENNPMWKKQHTEETIQKMVDAKEEYFRTHDAWNKGKTGIYSEETIQKMVDVKIGKVPWNKGKKCPQLSGENHHMWKKHHKEETKQKIANSLTGRCDSEETKRNKSIARKKHLMNRDNGK